MGYSTGSSGDRREDWGVFARDPPPGERLADYAMLIRPTQVAPTLSARADEVVE
jgi:hypothetical protein